MTTPAKDRTRIVFFFDVDNTLLDNDTVEQHLRAFLESELGSGAAARYWKLFEQLRHELGYADYLGALQRYRVQDLSDPRMLVVSEFLLVSGAELQGITTACDGNLWVIQGEEETSTSQMWRVTTAGEGGRSELGASEGR